MRGGLSSLVMLVAVAASLLATLVAGAFGTSLARQFRTRRRHHALAWAISLYLFAGGTLAIALGTTLGWSRAIFATYWITGALLTVPFLAVGQLHLMVPKLAALWWTVAFLYTVWALFTLLASPADEAVLDAASAAGALPRGAEVFGEGALTLGLLRFSNAIAIVPILGSIWSGFRTHRWGVLLIGVGAAVAGGSFSAVRLAEGSGQAVLTSVLLAAGVTLMYGGFLAAGRPSRKAAFTTPARAG